MKVAHLIWSLDVGGAESMLVDVANRQARELDVSLFVGNSVVDLNLLNALTSEVKLFTLRRPPGSRNPLHVARLNAWLWKLKPDLIHAHNESIISAVWAPFASRSSQCTTVEGNCPVP